MNLFQLGKMKSIPEAIKWLLALSLIVSSSALKCDRCHRTEKCTVKECPEPGKYGPFLCLSIGKREFNRGKGCFLKRLMQIAFKSDDQCREMNGLAALWLLAFEGEFGKDYSARTTRSVYSEAYHEFLQQLDDDARNTVLSRQAKGFAAGDDKFLEAVEEILGWFVDDDYSQGQGLGRQFQQLLIHLKKKNNYPVCSCSQDSCNNNDWIDEQNGNSGIKRGGKKNQASSLVAPGPGYNTMVPALAPVSLVIGFGF